MRYGFLPLTLIVVLLLMPASAPAQTFFTGTLTPAQESHDVTTDASGTAALALTEEGVYFYITVDGLSGAITAAHIHNAPAGTDGGVVRTLTTDFTGNTARGLWSATDAEPLTDEMIAALLRGDLYVNIHTAANPAGELRAQLYPTSGTGFRADLTTAQESHDVTTDASGTATLQTSEAGLLLFVTVDGLSGAITAAHIHNAPAGTDGGVVRTLTADFTGNTAFALWTPGDAEPLSDDLVRDLFLGDFYVNIHTAANPAGELRGQILLNSGWSFNATLDADQETHDVTSDGTGTAALTLTEDGVVFDLTVTGLSGAITAAHIHNAPAGMDGGVVRTLTADFTGNTARGLWTFDDAEPLTDDLIRELLLGNLYFNIHTAANPAGELRGQILPADGTGLRAMLTTAQESHDVTSDASGTAALALTEEGLHFFVTVDGLSGAITAAHIHNAPAGMDGGVVRTLTADFTGNTARGLWSATDAEPLTNEMIAALLRGDLYVNIHTADNPAGELRGQILLGGGTALKAMLTPAQETHDVTSDGTGTAALTLTPDGVVFDLTVTGLSGAITAAHIHNAPAGMDGGVVRTLTADFTGNTARGLWSATDTEPLTDDMIAALLRGDLYVNIHTAANPAGELRGQILLSSGVGAAVILDPAQETHDVTSDGTGTAALTLTPDGVVFDLTVTGLSGAITAAHIHNAPAGMDGGVVRTLTADFTGNTARGLWSATDTEPLTDDLIREFAAGNLYFNIHTAANPAGELRGQIRPGEVVATAIEQLTDVVPGAYRLAQNYPNPFNPVTTITFDLPRATRARLDVFDVLGRTVAVLLDARLTPGTYAVTFDATALPSGVYFYRLTAGDVVRTRQMAVLK
ncbi:MAG: hypothetical protein KatS3mg042_0198 [Rhodothermaceae bacterium]|nr:MAG: hypothetical protein KatS3mg042_0198 [Rhodothermaceae bacterium]